MDRFVQFTSGNCAIPGASDTSPGIGMDYYDGNTATGLWNYAQHYGMSDNSWDATFGPTMIGSLNMFGATTFRVTIERLQPELIVPVFSTCVSSTYSDQLPFGLLPMKSVRFVPYGAGGGVTPAYEVTVNPRKLEANHLTLSDLISTIGASSAALVIRLTSTCSNSSTATKIFGGGGAHNSSFSVSPRI